MEQLRRDVIDRRARGREREQREEQDDKERATTGGRH